jgi:lipopolysaccharide heptosyltransferase I
MKKVEHPSNIAIIRLSSLGDIVHTAPAFQQLRKKFPEARISWIVEPLGAKLLENFSGIDEIIVLDLKTGTLGERLKNLRRFLGKYRGAFDLVVDFQGLIKSAVLAFLLRGVTLGFHKKNLREPMSRLFYKKQAEIFDESRHVIYKNLHLLSDLHVGNGRLAYPVKPVELGVVLRSFMEEHNLEANQFLLLNVGGGWESKTLSTGQYVDVVNRLKDRYKLALLWGNQKEKQIAEDVSRQTGVPMAPFLSFKELIAFVRSAAILITADTLALHVADMVNTPSVGYFGPTLPSRNGSLLEESVAVWNQLPCSNCYKKKCDKADCLQSINLDKISTSVGKIYEKHA